VKWQFSEPVRSQLERALKGDVPKRSEVFKQKAMKAKPPSPKQIEWLKKFDRPIPATMAEASAMLDECFNK
jgi:hypothetical protein